MSTPDFSRPCAGLSQAFLVEPDAGLLCRILGLYAGRGLDLRQADYAPAGPDLMALRVTVGTLRADADDTFETLRVLAQKVVTPVGVVGVVGVGDVPDAAPPADGGAPGEPLSAA